MKIIHTADWHFREKDHDEIFKCVDFMVKKAAEEKPDLFCISGDLTDSKNLGLDSKSARSIFHIINSMLDIAPVAIVIGTPSHDGMAALALRECRGKYPILVSDMPGQYVYCADSNSFDPINETKSLPSDKFLITQIPQPTKQYFINDLSIEDTETAIGNAMGTMFAAFGYKAALFNDIPHIVNGHGQIGGAFISETQQLFGHDIEVSKAQLKTLNADLVCYGHIHKPQDMGDNILYSGSPTRMNHGEKEDKGFYVHEIHSHKTVEPKFIQTPARMMLEIKEDFTGDKEFNSDLLLDQYRAHLHHGSHMKIKLTLWQDEADQINQSELRQYFINGGCLDVKISIIRKPRETVRAERVLEAETLPEKLEAMAELRGETVSGSILEKAVSLEAEEQNPWVKTVKTIEDVKDFLDKQT